MTEEEKYERFERLHAVREVYYEAFDNPTGGSLHVVLDDGNMRDSDLRFCIKCAARENDYLGVAIGKLLQELPEEYREEWWESARRNR